MNKTEILNNVHEALESKGLNFKMQLAETYAMVDGVYVPTGRYTPIRDDKKGAEAVIKGVSFTDHYKPVQNEDAFSVLGEMADQADVEFKNIGSWGNGAGIFAQVSLGTITGIGSSDDSVGKYLSIVNSHDGSHSLQVLVTPYRFFCKNQISKAVGDAKRNNRLVSIKHDSRGEERLREVAQALVYANGVYAESEQLYKMLADTTVNMDQVREAIFRCFPLNKGDNEASQKRIEHNFERRVGKVMDRFNDADNGKMERMTAWNLYNAIQGTFQHDSRKTAVYERSLILGSIAWNSESALDHVQEVVLTPNVKTSTKYFDDLFAKVA